MSVWIHLYCFLYKDIYIYCRFANGTTLQFHNTSQQPTHPTPTCSLGLQKSSTISIPENGLFRHDKCFMLYSTLTFNSLRIPTLRTYRRNSMTLPVSLCILQPLYWGFPFGPVLFSSHIDWIENQPSTARHIHFIQSKSLFLFLLPRQKKILLDTPHHGTLIWESIQCSANHSFS